jgi:hypothetical protein
MAAELARAGHAVSLVRYGESRIPSLPPGPLLLRVSDPVMLAATRALTRAGRGFLGPAAAVIAHGRLRRGEQLRLLIEVTAATSRET